MSALNAVFRDRSSRSFRLVAVLLGLVAVVAVVGAVVAVRADGEAESRTAAGQEGRAFAVEIVPKLLSYEFSTVEGHFAELQDNLGGEFRQQFEEVGRSVIVPSAQERQVVTSAEVVESSVVRADVNEAELLLFVNQSSTSSESPDTKLDGSRVRVRVERSDDRWLITELTPV